MNQILLLILLTIISTTALAESSPPLNDEKISEESLEEDTKEIPQDETEQLPPPFQLLDKSIAAGEQQSLTLSAGQSFSGQPLQIPLKVTHGTQVGPVLCLIAATHGDELNGIEAVRRVLEGVDPENLSGTMIGIPVTNVLGFAQNSRYLPDRRDLNRYFPGSARGSLASRIAHLLFHNVVQRCEYLVDFHTGSFKRINLPQLRADLSQEKTRQFAQHFTVPVLHKPAGKGTLRAAAFNHGIKAVTFELGEPSNIQLNHVQTAVDATKALLGSLGMLQLSNTEPELSTYQKLLLSLGILKEEPAVTKPQQRTFYASNWIRVNHGGLLISHSKLGQNIEAGALLGVSINPLTNERHDITSSIAGKILGMARNQFMLPGFAAFHIGRLTPDPDNPTLDLNTLTPTSADDEADD